MRRAPDRPDGIGNRKIWPFLLLLLLAFCCIQGVSARVNVYTVVITPNDGIIGNQTPVAVMALMDITSEDQYTFSEDHTLRFWTDLQDPVWTPLLSRDGILTELPVRNSRNMVLTAWDLSYLSGSRVSLKVTLKGIAPNVSSTMDKTIIRIAEATPHSTIEETEAEHIRPVAYVPGARPPEDPYLPKGSIRVTSQPGTAAVLLDGARKGETPVTLDGVAAGPHTLTLSLPGYHETTLTVTVIERQTLDIATTLNPAPLPSGGEKGYLTVTSDPPGASVSLNGVPAGVTPLTNRETDPGIHPLRVSLPGYQEYSSDIQVYSGQGTTLAVRLVPAQGSVGSTAGPDGAPCHLGFSSDPPGADVYIDNRFVGLTPAGAGDLQPGKHTIMILLPFYRAYTEEVYLSPGEAREISTVFTLQDLDIPGLGALIDLLSQIKLPGLSKGDEKGAGGAEEDRQKAYEELVKSLGEEG